jgi:hypothetical protein
MFVKFVLYFLLLAIVCLAMTSSNLQTIRFGFIMLYHGECTHTSSALWALFGLENPVCKHYNHMLKIILNMLLGNPEAIATFSGIIALAVCGPLLVMNRIDAIANQVQNYK